MQVPKQQGVDKSTWKNIMRVMLNTGEFDPNLWDKLDSYQQFWVNQTKLAYRDLSKS